jgi:hypothetical protein
MPHTRRRFVHLGAAGFAALSSGVLVPAAQAQQPAQPPQQPASPGQAPPPPASLPPRPPAIAGDLVKEFVIAGHANLPRTQELLAATPGLLNASWDWGGGDFEMAIGGAGHMGNREIALYLISQGGRMDIFVAAMLGRLDIVEPALKAFPHLLHSKGPHGIPLITHAKKGGEHAAEVTKFLESLSKS